MPTVRKDLHIGLAIGGVLLAVLIVWGVVVSGSKKHNNQVTLDKTGANSGSDIPAPTTPPAPVPETSASITLPPPIIAPVPQEATDTPAPVPAADAKKNTDWVGLLAGNTPAPVASDANNSSASPVVTQSPDPNIPVVSAVLPLSQQLPAPDAGSTTNPPASASPVDQPVAADNSKPAPVDTPASPGARTHKVARRDVRIDLQGGLR